MQFFLFIGVALTMTAAAQPWSYIKNEVFNDSACATLAVKTTSFPTSTCLNNSESSFNTYCAADGKSFTQRVYRDSKTCGGNCGIYHHQSGSCTLSTTGYVKPSCSSTPAEVTEVIQLSALEPTSLPVSTLHERIRLQGTVLSAALPKALPVGWTDAGVGFCECQDGKQFGQGSDMPYRATIPQHPDVQTLEACLAAASVVGGLAADWNDGYKYCNVAFATEDKCKSALPDWNDSCSDGPACDLTQYKVGGGKADGGVECYTYSSSMIV